MRLPIIAEVQELLDCDWATKLAVIVGSHDEFFKAHNLKLGCCLKVLDFH
jgi:hypothetical protein